MNQQVIGNREQRFGGVAANGENRDSAPIIYLPTDKSQLNSKLKGIIGIVIGIMFAAIGLLFTVVMLFLFPPVAAISLLVLIFGLAMAAGFGCQLIVRKSEQLGLTTGSLVYKSRTKTIELQLTQINCIYAVQRMVWRQSDLPVKRTYQIFYWGVRIETAAGDFIELEVTQPNWLGTFDAGKLLNDLLPRLPISTQIDPRIRSYLQTGAIN